MSIVVAVKLRYNPKTLWFDPASGSYNEGDHVLVETERGREIGLVIEGAIEVTDSQLKELKSPLKPVIRALTDLDYDHVDQLDIKGREAMPLFRELIEKHGLEMKPVEVEYLFTGDRAVFYFSSDERIDFRELVRELASSLHIRVDMRQIGVRDEARMLGGLAHCGEELCCARMGGEFQPVSIRMAKEQDLPLNPAKISGACGRLMCCLRYEFEAYKDFKSRAPKKGALIETPLGTAKVTDFDTPREVIHMRLENGKELAVPLKDFSCDADKTGCTRPCRVSREALDCSANSSILLALSALDREMGLSEDILTDAPTPRQPLLRRRRRGGQAGATEAADKTTSERSAADKIESQRQKPRPGQRSSGLRNADRSERADSSARSDRGRSQERGGTDGQRQGQSRGRNRRPGQQERQAQKAQKVQPERQAQDRSDRQGQSGQKPRPHRPERSAPQHSGANEGSSLGGGRKHRRRHGAEASGGGDGQA
jgi:cell fate regulator YaaT (PSP1 superfamily)